MDPEIKTRSQADRVKAVIAEQLGRTEIEPAHRLFDDLEADSLDTVEITIGLEAEFGIEIPDDEAEKLATVQDCIDYVAAATGPKKVATLTRKVLRADGTEQMLEPRPYQFKELYPLINCDTFDVVSLRHLGSPRMVMLVDDNGMLTGKPVNAAATELYWKNCVPGTTHPIVGDVVIVPDGDFA